MEIKGELEAYVFIVAGAQVDGVMNMSTGSVGRRAASGMVIGYDGRAKNMCGYLAFLFHVCRRFTRWLRNILRKHCYSLVVVLVSFALSRML